MHCPETYVLLQQHLHLLAFSGALKHGSIICKKTNENGKKKDEVATKL